jgi:hypothetical protein
MGAPSSCEGVLKNNFGKKNFMQSMGRLSMQWKIVAVFFFGGGLGAVGGRGERDFFFPHFVPTVFSLCSHRVPK